MTDGNNPEWTASNRSLGPTISPGVISDIIADTETAGGAFISPDGLSRIEDGSRRHVDIPVLMVVTDRRILFVSAADGEPGADAGDLSYSDIATITVGAVRERQLEIATTDGVSWQFRFPSGVEDAVDAIARHLLWVSDIRSRILRLRSDVELAAGEIRAHAGDREWEEAHSVYQRFRASVDDLIQRVQLTRPIASDVLGPELTDIERTLEAAHARLYIERAQSQLELGNQLLAVDRHDQARTILVQTEQFYERARAAIEVVRRGDAFQFGPQRELNEALDRLRWNMEMVAAEPIRQAREAKLAAEIEPDPEAALEYWESAYRRYEYVETFDWLDDGQHLEADRETAIERKATAANESIRLHTELAATQWERTLEHTDQGEHKQALEQCQAAREHLERAHELAVTIETESVAETAEDLERVERAISRLRSTESDERTDPDTPDIPAEPDDSAEQRQPTGEDATPNRDLPSASDLADLDTHHEITLDTEDATNRWTKTDDPDSKPSESTDDSIENEPVDRSRKG